MTLFLTLFLSASAIAILLNVIFKRFQIPTIIGYVLTGAIIAQIFKLHSGEELLHVAEFGIVFLMFTIGLEFSIKHLMSMKKEVFINGGLQVLASGVLYSLVAFYIFGLDEKAAIVIGFALALSSTAIVLKILNDSGDIHTIYGRKALGILLFQDIAVIPLLLMIKIFTSESASLNALLLQTFTSAVIVIILLYIIGKYLLNRFLFWIVETDTEETFIATILFLVVGASFLAHYFGFSYSLGAFLAGMMIAETKYKYQIEADLIPFRNLLLGLFFITIGMQIKFSIIAQYLETIIALVVFLMVCKALIVFLILRTYLSTRISFKSAIAISQVGEFSLAVIELARANSLVLNEVASILVIVIISSMILTPFILRNIQAITDTVTNVDEKLDNYKIHSAAIKNHILICGYGKLGQEIVYKLKKQDIQYAVIEHDLNLVKLGKARGENVFFGNAAQKSILRRACVEDSLATIVAIDNEKKLRLVCESIKSFKKPINIIVKVSDEEQKMLLKGLHVNHILNEGKEIAKALVDEALTCKIDLRFKA